VSVTGGFATLLTTLIAVACSQFEKVKAAILDIRQQHITVHHGLEDEQVHTTANSDLTFCIRKHQEIMG
jgi:hypothetical protein